MFAIVKRGTDGEAVGLVFVKAATSNDAKEVVGIDPESSEWVNIPLDALSEINRAHAGYIEKTF